MEKDNVIGKITHRTLRTKEYSPFPNIQDREDLESTISSCYSFEHSDSEGEQVQNIFAHQRRSDDREEAPGEAHGEAHEEAPGEAHGGAYGGAHGEAHGEAHREDYRGHRHEDHREEEDDQQDRTVVFAGTSTEDPMNNTIIAIGGIYSQDLTKPPQFQPLDKPQDHTERRSDPQRSPRTVNSKLFTDSIKNTPLCSPENLYSSNVKRILNFTALSEDNISMSQSAEFVTHESVEKAGSSNDNTQTDTTQTADRLDNVKDSHAKSSDHSPLDIDRSSLEQTLTTLRKQIDCVFNQVFADFKQIESKLQSQQEDIKQLSYELEAFQHGSNRDLNFSELFSAADSFHINLQRGQQQLYSLYCESDLPLYIGKAREYLSDDTEQYAEHFAQLLLQEYEQVNSLFTDSINLLSHLKSSIQVANHAHKSQIAQDTQSPNPSVHGLANKFAETTNTPSVSFRARSASPELTKVRRRLPATPQGPSKYRVPSLQLGQLVSNSSPQTGFYSRSDTHIPTSRPPLTYPPRSYRQDTHPPPSQFHPHYPSPAPAAIPSTRHRSSDSPGEPSQTSRQILLTSEKEKTPLQTYSRAEQNNTSQYLLNSQNKQTQQFEMASAHRDPGSYQYQTDLVNQITEAFHKLQADTEAFQQQQSSQTASVSPTNYSLRHIPTFSGNANDDFEEWRRKFLNKIAYLTWPAEQQILLLDDALTDRANLFYRKLPAAAKQSMTSILSALEKQYGNDNMGLAERVMQKKRKQLPGESIEDYTSAILQLVHRLHMDKEVDQVALYIDGLDEAIQGDVYKMKPNSIDQAEKDARLALSTLNRKTNDISPKAIAAELVAAINKNSAAQTALVAMTGADHYIGSPQSASPMHDTSYFPQNMPNMVAAPTPEQHIAYAAPQQEQYQQQPQYPTQSYQQLSPSSRQNGIQQNTPRYRSQPPQQAAPQQYGQQYPRSTSRPNTQSRAGSNQYRGNPQYPGSGGPPQNYRTGQFNNLRPPQGYDNNRNPFPSDYRQFRTGYPFCRACDCSHQYGVHVRPSNGQRPQGARPPRNARPQSASN